MYDFSKIKRFFTFDRIIGYATIAGSIATIYGANRIYNLTIELKPVIEIIQEKRGTNPRIISDTVTIIRRDTVILRDTVIFRDTVSLPLRGAIDSSQKDKEWYKIMMKDKDFRERHMLP